MDTNLDNSMNLESSIDVDFDQSGDGTVINQADITLSDSHSEDIPMEFEHIEEQPMLMDHTGNEEIIDFMGDQISMQDYSVQDDQMTENIPFESQDGALIIQEESKETAQFNPAISVPSSGVIEEMRTPYPKIVQIKGTGPNGQLRSIVTKETLLLPKKSVAQAKQVAIAPKPGVNVGSVWDPFNKKGTMGTSLKQFAIAPKPLQSVFPKPVSLMKTVSSGSVTNIKGTSVFSHMGKKIVMVPASGAQKLKLVAAAGAGGAAGAVSAVRLINASEAGQAQIISTENSSAQGTKPILAKVVLQGQSTNSDANQSALTKLVPAGGAPTAAPQTIKYVTVQKKTMPLSMADKQVLLASPTKQATSRFVKKPQHIVIKSPTGSKLVPASALTPPAGTTRKVIVNANPAQSVVLKTTTAPKTGHITKVVSGGQGQKTQLHQINVPGKGVQFIRLVTNPSQATATATPKSVATAANTASKTLVFTNNKGNVIQMPTDKIVTRQPPPLVTSVNKLTSKPQQKLVRIAPLTSKTGQAAMMQPARSGQSLLAPLSPQQPAVTPETQTHETIKMKESSRHMADMPSLGMDEEQDYALPHEDHEDIVAEEVDMKEALQDLIAKTLTGEAQSSNTNEIEIEYDGSQTRHDSSGGGASSADDSHPLIVIPYCKEEMILPDNIKREPQQTSSVVNVEVDFNHSDQPLSPGQYASSEPELGPTELLLRPRKACNCTKSQCLKLYCDCFASGEFCNGCNCNNCHNNLENEELRQKAIRGCLDRNPNAFRPKIGKAKIGGPEIIRRHNKGCNCKRSGCLKNYCECYEAKIACTAICKCVGCRNVEDTVERGRHPPRPHGPPLHDVAHHAPNIPAKQPCSFMTQEVIEAVCQCLVAAAAECGEGGAGDCGGGGGGAVREVLEEFARCLHDIIAAAQYAPDSRAHSHAAHMLSQTEV